MNRLAELATAMEHLLHVMTGVDAENRRLAIRRLQDATLEPATEWIFDNGVAVLVQVPLRARVLSDAPGALRVTQ